MIIKDPGRTLLLFINKSIKEMRVGWEKKKNVFYGPKARDNRYFFNNLNVRVIIVLSWDRAFVRVRRQNGLHD